MSRAITQSERKAGKARVRRHRARKSALAAMDGGALFGGALDGAAEGVTPERWTEAMAAAVSAVIVRVRAEALSPDGAPVQAVAAALETAMDVAERVDARIAEEDERRAAEAAPAMLAVEAAWPDEARMREIAARAGLPPDEAEAALAEACARMRSGFPSLAEERAGGLGRMVDDLETDYGAAPEGPRGEVERRAIDRGRVLLAFKECVFRSGPEDAAENALLAAGASWTSSGRMVREWVALREESYLRRTGLGRAP